MSPGSAASTLQGIVMALPEYRYDNHTTHGLGHPVTVLGGFPCKTSHLGLKRHPILGPYSMRVGSARPVLWIDTVVPGAEFWQPPHLKSQSAVRLGENSLMRLGSDPVKRLQEEHCQFCICIVQNTLVGYKEISSSYV